MKRKNYIAVLGTSILGMGCVTSLVSCDGGSSGSSEIDAQVDEIVIPSAPNAANSELLGDAFDISGANVSLEAFYEDDVFDRINAARATNGLPALVLDSQLTSLAEVHNQGMISRANVGGTIVVDHIGAQGRANAAFGLFVHGCCCYSG